jgi:hypothetical protein
MLIQRAVARSIQGRFATPNGYGNSERLNPHKFPAVANCGIADSYRFHLLKKDREQYDR